MFSHLPACAMQACLSNFVVRAGEEVQYGWSEPHEDQQLGVAGVQGTV